MNEIKSIVIPVWPILMVLVALLGCVMMICVTALEIAKLKYQPKEQ